VLYAVLHLVTLLEAILYFSSLFVASCRGGYVSNLLILAAEIVLYLVYGAMSAARVYGINGRRWIVPSIVFILYLPNVAEQLYQSSHFIYSIAPPPVGCLIYYDIPVILAYRLSAISRGCIIASDALVLLATWHATYGIKTLANMAHMNISIVTLLLRDGTVFFGAILVLNILDIVLNFTNVFSYMSMVVDVLMTILISRLFLNLREIYISEDTISESSEMSTINFTSRILGPLGAPVDHGLSTTEDRLTALGSDGEEIAMSSFPGEDENHAQSEEAGDREVSRVAKEPLKYGLALG